MFSVTARNAENKKEKYDNVAGFSTKLEAFNWISTNRDRFRANGNWILEVKNEKTGETVYDEREANFLA